MSIFDSVRRRLMGLVGRKPGPARRAAPAPRAEEALPIQPPPPAQPVEANGSKPLETKKLRSPRFRGRWLEWVRTDMIHCEICRAPALTTPGTYRRFCSRACRRIRHNRRRAA